MLWYVGRGLQILGMIVILNAVVGGIAWAATMNQELYLTLLGGILFTAGYALVEKTKGT